MSKQNDALFKGIVPIHPREFEPGMPVDAAKMNMLASNLENLYCGANQVRVNAHLRTPIRLGYSGDKIRPNTKRLIQSFGPFPLTILKSGNAAPLYCEILGASSKAVAHSFIFAVIRRSDEMINVPLDSKDGMVRVKFTDNSMTWEQAGYLTLPKHRVKFSAPFSGKQTTAGGTVSPNCLWVYVDLFASIPAANASDGVFFQGFYATEVPYDVE